MTAPGPSPQDDPWAVLDGRTDAVADTSWLARLVALEDEAHDDECCEDER